MEERYDPMEWKYDRMEWKYDRMEERYDPMECKSQLDCIFVQNAPPYKWVKVVSIKESKIIFFSDRVLQMYILSI